MKKKRNLKLRKKKNFPHKIRKLRPKNFSKSFNVTKHKDYLSLLTKCIKNKIRRNYLIDFANKDELKAISEVMLNVLSGNIKLTPKILRKLKRERHYIRKLTHKKIPDIQKKRILKQKGGFLPLILPLVGTVLSKIFT